MEITIPVSNDWGNKARVFDFCLVRAIHRIGNRPTTICDKAFCPRSKRLGGVVGIMARFQSLLRSSVFSAQAKSSPPNSSAISLKLSTCSLTPAGEPWNSRNRCGFSGNTVWILDVKPTHL